MVSRWIRLNTDWSSSDWLAALDPLPRLLWPEFLCYVKTHGIAGRCKRSVEGLRRVTGVTRNDVTDLEKAAISDGAVRIEGSDWVVTNWAEHQGDTTAPERMRRYRERRKGDADNRNVTPGYAPLRVTDRHDTMTETERVKKDPSGRKKRWRFVPDDWEPTESHRTKAGRLHLDLDEQADMFRNHEFDKPKTDADRAFHNWLTKAGTFGTNGRKANGKPAGFQPYRRYVLPSPEE